jgi:hypothetical protein
MALTDENSGGMVMPVVPLGYGCGYGNQGGFGFGGDWACILLLLVLGGGWGGFGGFGMGGMMGAGMWGMMDGFGLYPWLNNSQNISDGFRDQQISTQISGIQGAITSGFGDVQTALCGGFAGVNQNVAQGFANTNLGMCQGFNGVNNAISGAQNAISQQLYTNEIASLNRSFDAQTANAHGFNGVQAGIADTKYTIASEECATRNASTMNTRDIIESQTRGTQAIIDKLCALELDGVRRENDQLRTQLNFANLQASQVAQTAELRASQVTTANQLVSELRSCPIPSQPVYGNQPIFTCPQTVASGCGCNGR